jgi:hypothetical protein
MERGLLFHFTEYDGLGQVSWAIVGTLTAAGNGNLGIVGY